MTDGRQNNIRIEQESFGVTASFIGSVNEPLTEVRIFDSLYTDSLFGDTSFTVNICL